MSKIVTLRAPNALLPTEPFLEPHHADRFGLSSIILAGCLIVVLFFVVFVSWAAIAPLNSAAVAPAVLTVDTRRKTVQHLEGGIVSKILVREGDVVAAGEILLRLDDVRTKAELDQLRTAYHALGALAARLAAERDGADTVTFPGWFLTLSDDNQLGEILDGQLSVFEARQNAQSGQVAILKQQIAQSDQQIEGLKGQIGAEEQQFAFLAEEVADLRTLLNKGLVPKPRVLALERQRAEIVGSRSSNLAAIAQIRKSIGESEIRIAELQTARINDAVAELQDVENRLRELAEEIRAAEDVYRRAEIQAPIGGTVVGLRVSTPGGVISSGEPLMDIVPADERLLVDARISPNDIDVVAPGLTAQVRLTAFQQRSTQPLQGQLISVSADSLADEQTGEPYYLGRIALSPQENDASKDLALHPGMQAQVFIITGRDTLLGYVLEPLVRTVASGLRED